MIHIEFDINVIDMLKMGISFLSFVIGFVAGDLIGKFIRAKN